MVSRKLFLALEKVRLVEITPQFLTRWQKNLFQENFKYPPTQWGNSLPLLTDICKTLDIYIYIYIYKDWFIIVYALKTCKKMYYCMEMILLVQNALAPFYRAKNPCESPYLRREN